MSCLELEIVRIKRDLAMRLYVEFLEGNYKHIENPDRTLFSLEEFGDCQKSIFFSQYSTDSFRIPDTDFDLSLKRHQILHEIMNRKY
jgi:hypothetical protein